RALIAALHLPPSTSTASRPPSAPPPPTSDTYTLSLHDALPILGHQRHVRQADGGALGDPEPQVQVFAVRVARVEAGLHLAQQAADRKSTRLNSSHVAISYAVFCLKKKTRVVRPDDSNTRL